MNIFKISPLQVIAAVSMMALGAFAAEKKTPGKTDAKDKHFMDEVTAVDSKSISIYHSPTKEVKYNITETTKVTVDYKPGKIDDVKTGMKAVVNHEGDNATSINATSVKAKGGKK